MPLLPTRSLEPRVLAALRGFRPTERELAFEAAAGGREALQRMALDLDPRIVVGRTLDNAQELFDDGGRITTVFDHRQPDWMPRSSDGYVRARAAQEQLLDLHGHGDRAGTTVYGRVDFGAIDGPRPATVYGPVELELAPRLNLRSTYASGDTLDDALPGHRVGGLEHLGLLLAGRAEGAVPATPAGVRDALRGAAQVLRDDPRSYVEAHVPAPHVADVQGVVVHHLPGIDNPRNRALAARVEQLAGTVRERGTPVRVVSDWERFPAWTEP